MAERKAKRRKVEQEMNFVPAFIAQVRQLYSEHRNSKNAAGMSKYMRDKFEFYGIKKPQRTQLDRILYSEFPQIRFVEKRNNPEAPIPSASFYSLLVDMWNERERETQYLAVEIFSGYCKACTNKSIDTDGLLATFEVILLTSDRVEWRVEKQPM